MPKPSVTIKARYDRRPPAEAHWAMGSVAGIPVAIAVTPAGELCRLGFAAGKTRASLEKEWRKEWPGTVFTYNATAMKPWLEKIGAGRGDVPVRMAGTEFQCAVWKNLLRIPRGETITYAELARRAGRPKAVRAAGTACGANPVAIVVPCHRVLASNGGLGGFGGGLPTKKKLLKAEGFQEL